MDPQTWNQVENRFDVVTAAFSTGQESDQSDLHDALQSALQEYPNLRAAVLASDGDWNTGQPPVQMATRMRLQQIPIFGVAAGSRTK